MVVTSAQNEARELVRDETELLFKYRSVVIGSGDGMLYEVVQGLMDRPDAEKVIQSVRLGILPFGSGNGLACSVLTEPQNGE